MVCFSVPSLDTGGKAVVAKATLARLEQDDTFRFARCHLSCLSFNTLAISKNNPKV